MYQNIAQKEPVVRMVKSVVHNNKKYYMCEACDMYYKNKLHAQQCEDFCTKYKSCDTSVIKHAIQLDTK